MLTFFTTGKPYRGHDAIIQRNALKSWTLLHPDVEVIVFGDEYGTAEICAELGLRHEPKVERLRIQGAPTSARCSRAPSKSRGMSICATRTATLSY